MRNLFAPALLFCALGFCASCSSTGKCGPDTCSGCCDASGKCQAGTDDKVCGQAGAACSTCPGGTTCYFRVCAMGGTGGGSAGGGGAATGGGSATGGGGSSVAPSTHFGPLQHWPVPDSTTAAGFYAPNVANAANQWSLIDLDGDGKLDLVQTADPASTGPTPFGADAGTASWRFFKNTGSGFALTATVWNLPKQANATEFNSATGGDGKTNWATVDLDGDKAPELVRTVDPDAGSAVPFDGGEISDGGEGWYWQTFANSGSGFSGTPGKWDIPESGSANGFNALTSAVPTARWSVFDLSGDGLRDLVQTSDPASSDSVFTSGGMSFWKVYLNDGSAFAGTPTTWVVPSTPTAGGFYAPAVTSALRNWALFDLDGDGAPELVQTSDPTTLNQVFGYLAPPTVWQVYLNTGHDFLVTANAYPVPDSATDGGFFAPNLRAANTVWSVADLTGDHRADLIQTNDPKRAKGVFGQDAGMPYWKLYPASASGFGGEADFPVPDAGVASGFYAPSGAGGAENWVLIDLDGDGRLDLVQTGDPAAMNTVFNASGSAEWHVWRGVP